MMTDAVKMEVDHNIDNESRLLITTCIGNIVEDGLVCSLQKYQKNIQNHPDYKEYNEVLIFPEQITLHLTPEGLMKLASLAAATDSPGGNRKLAIVVNSSLAYGFALMYKGFRDLISNSSKEIKVFMALKPALEWANNS